MERPKAVGGDDVGCGAVDPVPQSVVTSNRTRSTAAGSTNRHLLYVRRNTAIEIIIVARSWRHPGGGLKLASRWGGGNNRPARLVAVYSGHSRPERDPIAAPTG